MSGPSGKSIKVQQREAARWFISTMRWMQKVPEKMRKKIKPEDIEPGAVLYGRRAIGQFVPGQIYFWFYDPKLKSVLKFYDTAPLVVILHIYDDGFLGLNCHYLPYVLRNKLIKMLYKTMSTKNLTHKSRAKLNYAMIKEISKWNIAKPALKRYLFSHMRSKIVRIHPENWKNVALLPIERFVKASKHKVWKDSQRKIGK